MISPAVIIAFVLGIMVGAVIEAAFLHRKNAPAARRGPPFPPVPGSMQTADSMRPSQAPHVVSAVVDPADPHAPPPAVAQAEQGFQSSQSENKTLR